MPTPSPDTPPVPDAYGIVAELPTPAALIAAARGLREAGYKKLDAHSPYPVHGIDAALGVRLTRLPWLVFLGGLAGLSSALLLQWWTNAVDYPFNISGKPLFSLPANIPVIFELTILVAGLTAFFGVLGLNVLPRYHHPLFSSERFRRVTTDSFFISVEASDPRFNIDALTGLLKGLGAVSVEVLPEAPEVERRLPRALIYGVTVAVCASLVPFALFARARLTTTTAPPIDLISDMDAQPKYKAQAASAFFPDQRAYREQVPGTVAQEDTTDDTFLWQGKVGGYWATTLPPEIDASEATIERGHERFGIYCAPCHGLAGGGDGPVARRAEQLREGTWVPPTALTAEHVRVQTLGQIVNTISNGIRNMPAYGPQIAPADRWAIALYVKALERSQATSLDDVPAADRATLR